jgi:hypothetical protein
MTIAAGEFSKAKAVDAALLGINIPSHIIEAVKLIKKAKGDGESLEMVLNQGGFFDEVPEDTKCIARFINNNIRSAKRMGAVFKEAANILRKRLLDEKTPKLIDMGESLPTPTQIVDLAIEKERASRDGGKLFEATGDFDWRKAIRDAMSFEHIQSTFVSLFPGLVRVEETMAEIATRKQIEQSKDVSINPKVVELVLALNRKNIPTVMSGDLYGRGIVYVDVPGGTYVKGELAAGTNEYEKALKNVKLPKGWSVISADMTGSDAFISGKEESPYSGPRETKTRLIRKGDAITPEEAIEVAKAVEVAFNKEPWEMTIAEFWEKHPEILSEPQAYAIHFTDIQDAIKAGKNVPAEVKDEYRNILQDRKEIFRTSLGK